MIPHSAGAQSKDRYMRIKQSFFAAWNPDSDPLLLSPKIFSHFSIAVWGVK